MQQLIENIRSKPHHKRNQIIWAIAAVVAVLLIAAWLIVGNNKKPDAGNFFQSFNQGFQEGKDDFKNPLE